MLLVNAKGVCEGTCEKCGRETFVVDLVETVDLLFSNERNCLYATSLSGYGLCRACLLEVMNEYLLMQLDEFDQFRTSLHQDLDVQG